MATYSWNARDGGKGYLQATFPNITTNGRSFSYAPTASVRAEAAAQGLANSTQRQYERLILYLYSKSSGSFLGNTTYKRTGTIANSSIFANMPLNEIATLYTSRFFNSSNPTRRTEEMLIKIYGFTALYPNSTTYYYIDAENMFQLASVMVTLDVPPTFSSEAMTFDTPWKYSGLTTASVDVDNMTAYYGGYITEAKLTIGNRSAVITGNATNVLSSGTISMLLEEVGTFTPTLTVTDSRGQVKTETLEPITVLGYTTPSVSLSVQRTLNTGVPNDEGTYATVTAQFTFTDVIATLEEPTVSVSGLPSINVTWYKSRNAQTGVIDLTSEVDWNDTSGISTGDTLYALIGTFQPNESYVISVTPTDSQGTGTAQTITLPTAFYTIDFLAGGHGIAFGKPSTKNDVFECDLEAQFNKDFHAYSMIGFIQMFAGQTAPTGWKLCNGQELLIADYPRLYAVIGDSYGTPSDNLHFKLPDLINRFPVGAGDKYSIAHTGGSEYLQAHKHGFTHPKIPNHRHNIYYRNKTNIGSGTAGWWVLGTNATNNGNSNAIVVSSGGGGATYEGSVNDVTGAQTGNEGNMPPYVAINYIIYAGV